MLAAHSWAALANAPVGIVASIKAAKAHLRAGATIFRRKHCLRRFDIRQGAASFRPPRLKKLHRID